MNEIVQIRPLPERQAVEELDHLLAAAAEMATLGFGSDIEGAKRLVSEIERALVEHAGLARTETVRPATPQQIVGFVTALDSAFRSKSSPEFIAMLTEDVANEEPSIGTLRAATSSLRLGPKFMPSISEVVEVLRREATKERGAARALERLPVYAAAISAMLDDRNRPG